MSSKIKILIGVLATAVLAGGILVWRYWLISKGKVLPIKPEKHEIPLATRDVFINHSDYIDQKFRFQGCFEPHECTMATSECNMDNLSACCDCLKNYERCLIVDLQLVPKEKLIEVRRTNETKYYVEVVGTVISSPRMRPVVINATDLAVLGDCQTQTKGKQVAITTDKTEYEQGEIVKVTILNDLDGSIFALLNPSCIGYPGSTMERKEDGRWERLEHIPPPYDASFDSYTQIKPGEIYTCEWDQKVLISSNGEPKREYVEAGKFRVKSKYILESRASQLGSSNKEDVFPREGDFITIYSNEFTIKEN